MKTAFTLKELKKITELYDECVCRYPENEYEGKAFYDWLIAVKECDWFLEIFNVLDLEKENK
jgi:hypothetical protein